MDRIRLWHTLRLCSIRGANERAEYLKKHHVLKSVGRHCSFMPRKVPLYPNLIKLGDYVNISSNVSFFTHDGVHNVLGKQNEVLPKELKDHKFDESIGCIEIGNHVFIAANVAIGYNTKIGDNVVVTAGSVITNDIPSNSVVRGNPAKVICTLTQYLAMKAVKKTYPAELDHRIGQYVSKELEDWLWEEFNKSREKK
ncbi:MAG: acyltransferase [Dorea sp.]|jgi:acetyltransferase-like isoleucine patch superfamily enzyme|nr:acyltransferase [Dorea sp.]GFI43975.1 maltose O-acetyltransferase [Lachnospiraceae bacterium]